MNTKYSKQLLFRFLSVSAVLLLALSPFGGALAKEATTYAVNTTDDADDGACNKAHCSLREAINAADAHAGADKIEFKIRGDPPFTIQPLSAFPDITDPVTIDGTTQRGYAGKPIVELDGTYAGEVVGGLVIVAGDSTIKGLAINRFSGDGIVLTTNGGNTIQGNFIGTDVTGTVHLGNYRGVLVEVGSSGNLIGGTGAHDSNLISGNEAAGIRLSDAGTEGNKVQGNFLGTDITGMSRLGNNLGVRITNGAANNVIGGTQAGARNVISGNDDIGVYIDIEDVEGTMGNIVQGNYIGTNVIGSSTASPAVGEYTVTAMEETCPTYPAETGFDDFVSGSDDPVAPWSWTSVHFVGTDGCSNEMLGAASLIYRYRLEFTEETQLTSIAVAGAAFNGPGSVLRVLDEDKNVLGSTDTFGGNFFTVHFVTLQNVVGKVFFIEEFDTSSTWRYRERILINASPLGNYYSGVGLAGGAWGNLIMQNVISGNLGDGVEIFDPGTTGNTLQGNYIGTDLSGNIALPNISSGVWISDAESNLIAGNVISGNGSSGIGIWGIGSTGNVIRGNLIGTNADGTAPLPNNDGIWMGGEANNNTIGGTTAEERNVISGNGSGGISINEAASANLIIGNFIGTDKTGTLPLENNWCGVFLGSGSNNNIIGGTQAGAGNLISANIDAGVKIADPDTTGNVVQGNFIGTDVTGKVALGNSGPGVNVEGGASGNLIGGTGANTGNLISGNRDSGVRIANAGTEGNKVQGNLIGTDINGTGPLGNGYIGIQVTDGAADNLIGGTEDGARNVISGNNFAGVAIAGNGTTGNTVQGNYIGTDRDGSVALANVIGVLIVGDATGNLIGGIEAGARNVISGNPYNVIFSVGGGKTGNTLQGNYIGLDSSGSKALAYTDINVLIFEGATDNLIGGTEDGARNVISGASRYGVAIDGGGTTGNTVQGNYIGTDATGMMPLGNLNGVAIGGSAAGNLIGGMEPGAGNTIAFNTGAGIELGLNDNGINAGSGNALLSNSVYSNGGLGIDLGNDGVTYNDPGDTDTGPNDLQNFPVITAVRRVGRAVMIYGTLESTPSTKFRLEFFSNEACDPSGYGEGQAFLGFSHVKTDQAGMASFIITLPVSLPQEAFVTATATDPGGSTSEFSACFMP
jgi:CSLREA domain-containing protein